MAKFEILQEKIRELSKSVKWDRAKLEWSLSYIYDSTEKRECICGHYPIKEICVIKNNENGNEQEIGNHCVKQFLGLNTSSIFSAIKKIKKSEDASVDSDTLDYAYDYDFISEWDYDFYSNIRLKRILSDKQLKHKIRINNKITEISKPRSYPT